MNPNGMRKRKRTLLPLLATLALAGGAWAEPEMNDFNLAEATIPVKEIHSGGPPRDGIPSIDEPKFEDVEAADKWLRDKDPVVSVELEGHIRAYPLRILVWHEIVNDRFGATPVAVTYCPLCGTAMVFKARVAGLTRTFGVSGLLFNSDVLMYDRETESLWSQLAMKAVSGPAVGKELELLTGEQMNWEAWKERFPQGKVLSRDTGTSRNYRSSPYRSYERTERLMFPVRKYREDLKNKAWVAGLIIDGRAVAFPLAELEDFGTIKAKAGDAVLEITYNAEADHLTASLDNGDEPLPVTRAYWFAWQAFYPETALWRAP